MVAAEEELVDTRTRIKDLEREISRAEVDVETVRNPGRAVTSRLWTPVLATPKQMTDIQHELQSLARRQAELEDVEIEIMERLEETAAGLQGAEQRMAEARTRAEETSAAWDRREDEIVSETAQLEQRREAVVADLPADLVALYEKIRDRSGVGAALLRHGQCGACQLMLSSADRDRVRAAAPDEVVRCDECGAIMVRTRGIRPVTGTVVDFPAGVVHGAGVVEHVLDLDGRVGVVTDRTPFHPVDPSWPDQPADFGTLNGLPVVDCLVGAIDADGVIAVDAAIQARRGDPEYTWVVVHVVDGQAPAVGDGGGSAGGRATAAGLSRAHTGCHVSALALNAVVADLWRKEVVTDGIGNPDFDRIALTSSRMITRPGPRHLSPGQVAA